MAEIQTDAHPGVQYTADLLCREAPGQPFRSIALAGDRLRIGRRFENDLILSHASVSRFHAEILREEGGWWVVDCGSKFGTSVNGERLSRAPLSPGDRIRIGGEDGPLLIFNPSSAAEQAARDEAASAPPAPSRDDSPSHTPSGAALWLVERFRATSLLGDYREALALVADAALELTHFERAALLLTSRGEGGDGPPQPEVERSRSGHALAADGIRDAAFAGAVVDTGRTLSIAPEEEPVAEERELAALARSAGVVRAVCVPLRALSAATLSATGEVKRTTVGALYLEGGSGSPPVTEGVRSVLESIASEAGLVVERLYEQRFGVAGIRARQIARAAELSARAADERLAVADRARAASELAVYLLTTGDAGGAVAALAPYEDPAVRAQLPDSVRAEVLDALGIAFMWEARWHRAAGVFNAALGSIADGQDPLLEMAIRSRLALCYVEIGEIGIARELAHTAASFLRRTDEGSAEYARALFTLGSLERRDHDLTSAAHAFRLAARVADQTDDLVGRAIAYFGLGLVYADRGDLGEAISSLQRMLELGRALGNSRLLLAGQRWLADCLVRTGAWRRAEAVIAAGLGTPGPEDSRADRAWLLLLAATIAVRRDGGAEAEQAVARARDYAAGLADRLPLAEACVLEAELRLAARDLFGARTAVSPAAEIAREAGDARLQGRVHLVLAEAARREMAGDTAESHVARAQRLATRSRDMGLAGAAQHAFGRLNADRGRFTEAQHHLAQSLSIFRTVDDRPRIAAVHLDLGHLMLAAGDPACARTHLQLAKEIFLELGILPAIASAEAGLSDALAAGGPEAPASYSSIVLGASSEARFVRRLLEAAQSRDLLTRELTSIAIDISRATWAAVLACEMDGTIEVGTSSGEEGERELPFVTAMRAARGEISRHGGMTFYPIEPFAGDKGAAAVLALDAAVGAGSRAEATLLSAIQLTRHGLELVSLRTSLKRAELPDPASLFGAPGQPTDTGAVSVGLVYASPRMEQLVERLQRIRTSAATILITGESGVGKEVVALAIHAASARPRAPFIPFNCTAGPRDLIESQLFGHKRGAFTGATADFPGVARTARGGTLFLDEVGDLPLEVQPKLLRFLESGEIQPLGETQPQRVDLRVVAVTNVDLERAVEEGRFREDLFHRLNIIRIHVPPLRERKEDIPILTAHFLARLSERAGYERPPAISEEVLALLTAYPWPGNVRQLRNEIERIIVTFATEGATVTKEMLSPELLAYSPPSTSESAGPASAYADPSLPLPDRLRLFEVEQITRALADSDFNLTHAASRLGMARQNLQRRLKKLGLASPEG